METVMGAKRDNTPLVVLLAVGGVLALGCVGVGALVAYSMSREEQMRERKIQALPTRDEMRAKLDGKTKDEVMALLGKPDSTDDGPLGYWLYRDRVVDPVSGKVDSFMFLRWDESGRVKEVDF